MSNERDVAKTEQAINVSEMLKKLDDAEAIIKSFSTDEEFKEAKKNISSVINEVERAISYDATLMKVNIENFEKGVISDLTLLVAILIFRNAIREKLPDAGSCSVTVIAPEGCNISVTKVEI